MTGTEGNKRGLLRRVGICADLSDEQLDELGEHLQTENLAKGRWLFRQGEPGDRLYLVEKGRVAISVARSDGKEMTLATFDRGSFFGEMSIIDGEPRSAGCRAEVRSRLLSLAKSSFYELKHDNPGIAFKLMRRMILDARDRMQHTNAFLSELVQWGEEARRRAITDELTGLYNRRYLDDTLEHMVASTQHNESELSLVMIDLDHFSSINELYSQSVGDQVLTHVVEVFRQSLRDGDVAARYGGDEFNIILPATDREAALEVCSTIRQRVEALDMLRDRGGPINGVTTSQGIATLPENANDAQGLREAADAALYAAKEAGRNRVCHATTVLRKGA